MTLKTEKLWGKQIKLKSGYLKKTSNIDEPLARLRKKMREDTNDQHLI